VLQSGTLTNSTAQLGANGLPHRPTRGLERCIALCHADPDCRDGREAPPGQRPARRASCATTRRPNRTSQLGLPAVWGPFQSNAPTTCHDGITGSNYVSEAVSEVVEEAAYEAGRRGAKQSACNATGKGREEEAWRATQPDYSEGPIDAFVAYSNAVQALVMKDLIAEECFEFPYHAWQEVIDQQTNPTGE
jgi:hypothetical protein